MVGPLLQFDLFGDSKAVDEDGGSASEAVSADMAKAMMMYMPLRTIASFSGGKVSYDMLRQLVDGINKMH